MRKTRMNTTKVRLKFRGFVERSGKRIFEVLIVCRNIFSGKRWFKAYNFNPIQDRNRKLSVDVKIIEKQKKQQNRSALVFFFFCDREKVAIIEQSV